MSGGLEPDSSTVRRGADLNQVRRRNRTPLRQGYVGREKDSNICREKRSMS